MMESQGSFGDLLAAFNIDSEDTDIAEATHQYDEANTNEMLSNEQKEDAEEDSKELATNQPPAEIKTEAVLADDQNALGKVAQNIDKNAQNIDQNNPSVNPVKLVYDNSTPTSIVSNSAQTYVPSSISTSITPVSIDNLGSVQSIIPQMATIMPPVISSPVPQLATDTLLLPNLAQNTIVNQTVVPQTQLQPLMQPIQSAGNLLANQIPVNNLGLLNPDVTGLVDLNGGAAVTTATVVPQGILQGMTPQPAATIVNFGGIQNNLIAMPMTLVPPVVNQNTIITQNNVTPTLIPSPVITPPLPADFPKLPIAQAAKMKDDSSQFSHKYCKKKPVSQTPTVQELLDEQRRKKSKGNAAVVVSQTTPMLPLPQPITLPVCNSLPLQNPMPLQNQVVVGLPLEKPVIKTEDPQIELPPSKTGRRRKPTKRYVEFMTSKDESEEDLQESKKAPPPPLAKPKSPVIDLNKPLTDQLITIAETTGIPSQLKISHVRTLAASPGSDLDSSNNAIKIKTEPMDLSDKQVSGEDKSEAAVSSSKNEDEGAKDSDGIVLPDGMRIKEEPEETSTVTKRKLDAESEPEQVSKRKREESGSEKSVTDKPEKTKESESIANKPVDFRKPIKTREEEERVASEAAAKAAAQALLRVAAKEKEEAGPKSKEDAVKKAMLEIHRRKVEEAETKMREEAQKTASEAAARAASMAQARVIAMETEPDVDQKSLEDAAEAARIASEAATRAAAEAAKRAAAAAASAQISDKVEDLRVAEKVQQEAEEAERVASEAAARAAAQAAARAAALQAAALQAAQNESPVDLRIASKTDTDPLEGVPQQQVDLSWIAEEAAARAVLAAQSRCQQNFVPILPALPLNSYSKPTHINQILKPEQTVANIAMVEPIVQATRDINKVVTSSKQIITYPKNPSKNLRESLAWKSFQEGVKQGKYKVVQKSEEAVVSTGQNGRARRAPSHSINAISSDMKCPYCLIQMKVKSNLVEHIWVCLINPETRDYDYLQSHVTSVCSVVNKSPVFVCPHCTPNATSVKDLKSWSNVLCRQCVTKCADTKIAERTEDHFIVTKSGFFVCKHCGIGLDTEKDMVKHHSQEENKNDTSSKTETNPELGKKLEGKSSLPVSKILGKKEPDSAFQFRCGQCRLMFASVGLLLVHTSHCNLKQYLKVLERLSFYNCFNCPVACKVVPDVKRPHKCKVTGIKILQAVREISVSQESFVCLRCEEVLPSNGHLVLHTKQCNHAQYHLLMRYLDQPPFCSRCLMVFTGYKAYSQHSQRCSKIRHDLEELAECPLLSFCLKCDKAVQREEVDQMYHNAVCVGLPCTQQKLLFPDGFNIKECCTVINSW